MWVRAKEPGFVGGIYRDKASTVHWPDGLRLGKWVEEAGDAPADAVLAKLAELSQPMKLDEAEAAPSVPLTNERGPAPGPSRGLAERWWGIFRGDDGSGWATWDRLNEDVQKSMIADN